MLRSETDDYIHDDVLEWAVEAETHGILCLRALVLSIERGDTKLPIELEAWENTMCALEWMLTKRLEGPLYRVPPFVPEDLGRVRRVHALGTEAISGGERAPELGPLADQFLSSVLARWRSAPADFPVCYPVPEDYEVGPERGTSGPR